MTVTATNKGTGEVRTTVTNEVGIYRLQSLDPGTYDLVADCLASAEAGASDVVVSVGASVGVNLTMAASGVTETVQVRESPRISRPRRPISRRSSSGNAS